MHAARQILATLGLLLVTASVASPARAEGPVEVRPRVGKVGLRVLQIFADTRQALVFDKDAGRHVVLGEGDRLGKYEIMEIEDDEVLVRVGSREVVLMVDPTATGAQPGPGAPPTGAQPMGAQPMLGMPPMTAPGERTILDPYGAATVRAPSVAIEAGPLDPYAPMMMPPASASASVLDPYAPVREVLAPDPAGAPRATTSVDSTPVTVVSAANVPAATESPTVSGPNASVPTTPAPTGSGANGPFATVSDPTGSMPTVSVPMSTPVTTVSASTTTPVTTVSASTTTPVTTVSAPIATPSTVSAPTSPSIATAPSGTPAVETIRVDEMTLARPELSAALADFDKLSKEIGFARTGTGIKLSRVPPASYFHRLGFRAGDVVTTIDGAPMRSLDDAAGVYVRLGTAKKLVVEIERAGTRGTLRFAMK